MPLHAMASYLRALHTHSGPGLAPLPLQACSEALGLDGLALLLAHEGSTPELVQSFGERTGALEDLQLTQGHGPSRDAADDGALLLMPDMGDATGFAVVRWPGLPYSVEELGVAAVFAFPLRIGVIALGALTGHRTTPGPLGTDQLADAFALADTLSQVVITLTARPAPSSGLLLDETCLHFAEVHQATGMLAAQLEIPCAQALIRLRAYAYSHNRRVLSCARDVIQYRLDLDDKDDKDS
ncbi:ANTAR domain-containing protein [Streptomyces sp. NBC_01381]|uniref:ANTAR domain-containing protein n=1 Tax=Streptomyces sp. NBC_01381 TaxID=2903845 RepID=UPI0022596DE5|nr:ANTAR domain-containing protein [Streptomyces sp. NBC_01381]MCX4667331.1 ANTAR domain-containing protein [Streptomyces sp. NBC_01381]